MNAYILSWTMNDYAGLKEELRKAGFEFQKEDADEDIRAKVSFDRIDEFSALIKKHLNAPYNYVDIQFPEEKVTVIVFRDKTFFIHNQEECDAARTWAISIGLPEKQADWSIVF